MHSLARILTHLAGLPVDRLPTMPLTIARKATATCHVAAPVPTCAHQMFHVPVSFPYASPESPEAPLRVPRLRPIGLPKWRWRSAGNLIESPFKIQFTERAEASIRNRYEHSFANPFDGSPPCLGRFGVPGRAADEGGCGGLHPARRTAGLRFTKKGSLGFPNITASGGPLDGFNCGFFVGFGALPCPATWLRQPNRCVCPVPARLQEALRESASDPARVDPSCDV